MHLIRLASWLTSLVVTGSVAQAGVHWTLEHRLGTTVRASTYWMDGQRVRIETPPRADGKPGRVVLYDAATKRLVLLDPEARTWRTLPIAALTAARTGTAEMSEADLAQFLTPEQLARLQSLPPEQRRELLRGTPATRLPTSGAPSTAPAPAPSFARAGDRRVVNGFRCETVRVELGGRLLEEDCVAPWGGPVALTKDELTLVGKLALALDTTGADKNATPNPDFSKYPGFPIERALKQPDGTTGLVDRLTLMERVRIPASQFDVPVEYREDTGRLEPNP